MSASKPPPEPPRAAPLFALEEMDLIRELDGLKAGYEDLVRQEDQINEQLKGMAAHDMHMMHQNAVHALARAQSRLAEIAERAAERGVEEIEALAQTVQHGIGKSLMVHNEQVVFSQRRYDLLEQLLEKRSDRITKLLQQLSMWKSSHSRLALKVDQVEEQQGKVLRYVVDIMGERKEWQKRRGEDDSELGATYGFLRKCNELVKAARGPAVRFGDSSTEVAAKYAARVASESREAKFGTQREIDLLVSLLAEAKGEGARHRTSPSTAAELEATQRHRRQFELQQRDEVWKRRMDGWVDRVAELKGYLVDIRNQLWDCDRDLRRMMLGTEEKVASMVKAHNAKVTALQEELKRCREVSRSRDARGSQPDVRLESRLGSLARSLKGFSPGTTLGTPLRDNTLSLSRDLSPRIPIPGGSDWSPATPTSPGALSLAGSRCIPPRSPPGKAKRAVPITKDGVDDGCPFETEREGKCEAVSEVSVTKPLPANPVFPVSAVSIAAVAAGVTCPDPVVVRAMQNQLHASHTLALSHSISSAQIMHQMKRLKELQELQDRLAKSFEARVPHPPPRAVG